MNPLKKELAKRFLVPQGTFGRRIDAVFIFLAAAINLFVFYLITYNLCANAICEKLKIMNMLVYFSPAYLLLALADIGIGVYFIRTRSLEKIYAYAFTIFIGFRHALLWLIPFAIAKEVNTVL